MKANKKPIKVKIRSELVYPELSYKIMGVLFKVHSKLVPKYQEKYYQRAIEIELQRQGIPYMREKMIRLEYEKKGIGRYFIDFVIEGKIALEVKASDYFRRDFTPQVLGYLNSADLKLGIIANFNSDKLRYKRLVNSKIKLA